MNSEAPATRNRVFVSYSRKDRNWVERVREHLRPLELNPALLIDVWDDSEIEAGADWMAEIKSAIASTRVVVLLVSPAFLASDFIAKNELPPLLDAARAEGVVILPVHVKPSSFNRIDTLSHFQSVNDPNAPLTALPEAEQDRTLVKLADAVERAFKQTRPAARETTTATTTVAASAEPSTTRPTAALKELPRVKTVLEELRQTLRDKLDGDDTLVEPAALVAESILLAGLHAVARRAHPKQLARALTESHETAEWRVRNACRPLETKELKSQLLRYAAAGDADVYRLSEDALNTDSFNNSVWVEHGHLHDDVKVKRGVRLDTGYLGSEFVPNAAVPATVLDNVFFLINGETIGSAYFLKSVLHPLFYDNLSGTVPHYSLVIIADGFQGEALRAVQAVSDNVVAVKPPGYGDRRWALLEDLAALTGGSVLPVNSPPIPASMIRDYLGKADRVIVTDQETFIIGPRGSDERLRERINEIREQIPNTPSDYDKEKLAERLRLLEGGVTVVQVGGKTDEEKRRKAETFRRLHRHYVAARAFGVVAGEHLTLANAAASVCARPEEEKTADRILSDALEAPLRRLAEGWGRDGDMALRAVRTRQLETNNPNVGYYGEDDSFVDLFEVGAIVPAQNIIALMREAVNAASQRIAALRFTDEVVREAAALEGR